MPNELRIILDKTIVQGLNNLEIDSLDRYFLQIIPPILRDEILGDLSYESENSSIVNNVSSFSYRISGNRALTHYYWQILINSLTGRQEISMEGKIVPLREKIVRRKDGLIGTKVETLFEDETIARWERKNFTNIEKKWANAWRKRTRNIYPRLYMDKINEAGIQFNPPKDEKELVEFVDSLSQERKFQRMLLFLLYRENNIPYEFQKEINTRWTTNGRPLIKDFAPYAFFCVRANLLLAIGLTNPEIFKSDKHNKRDLEYCYYLPHCEIFSSSDNLHKKLIPLLVRDDQSFVEGNKLKKDLNRLSEDWNKLSKDEQINVYSERGFAPPENEDSIVFKLWQKHRKELSKPIDLSILNMKVIDSSLPVSEQKELTFGEALNLIADKIEESDELSKKDIDELRKNPENDPRLFVIKTTKIRKDRLLKKLPHLKLSDLN